MKQIQSLGDIDLACTQADRITVEPMSQYVYRQEA